PLPRGGAALGAQRRADAAAPDQRERLRAVDRADVDDARGGARAGAAHRDGRARGDRPREADQERRRGRGPDGAAVKRAALLLLLAAACHRTHLTPEEEASARLTEF